jgi:hypothetical protein
VGEVAEDLRRRWLEQGEVARQAGCVASHGWRRHVVRPVMEAGTPARKKIMGIGRAW